MSNVQIRKMTYDDIPLICKVDNDESESNIEYLKNNLENIEIERLVKKMGSARSIPVL
ncbi:MAG: hypothetical protein IKP88_11990 [Lachnospiraceae bacterium]|nr:hypothetical protein [Lachnospiraceae bacterium]